METVGELSFDQDLLMSKVTVGKHGAPTMEGYGYGKDKEPAPIPRAQSNRAHIQGASLRAAPGGLQRRAGRLRAALHTRAREEWQELLTKLRVKCAMIYPKSSRIVRPVVLPGLRGLPSKAQNLLGLASQRSWRAQAQGVIDSRPAELARRASVGDPEPLEPYAHGRLRGKAAPPL